MARPGVSRDLEPDGIARKRNLFTAKEDAHLRELVTVCGSEDWEKVAGSMPGRTCRQCRERWFNYLSPSVRTEPWSEPEVTLLVNKVSELGPRWKSLEIHFPGRTDINIRNRYRQLQKSLGVSPETILSPKTALPGSQAPPEPQAPESTTPRSGHLPGFDDIIAALVRESENANPDGSSNPFLSDVLF
jgi:hypothetical protein